MTENQVRKSKHEGIKKYEKFILGVCNAEYFSALTDAEKNGYYGVAMLLAYREGAKPNLKEFAYRLRVSPLLLEEAFNNLRANGVFSPAYAKEKANPKGLKIDRDIISHLWVNSEKRDLFNWSWVAGVGAGLCGLR